MEYTAAFAGHGICIEHPVTKSDAECERRVP
jgi:hypothetical protein